MTQYTRRGLLALGAAAGLSSCGLPRGAPLSREVLSGSNGDRPDFAVYQVTRDFLSEVSAWPRVGVPENRGWIGSSEGAASPLIAVGDRIDLRIWDPEQNSLITPPTRKATPMEGLTVSPQGTIFVPYAEEIRVAGMTPQAARRHVQSALEDIASSAQVQLTLVSGKRNSVDVVGGVTKPGSYPLPDRDTSVLNVVSAAGGVPANLRNPLVRLMRDGEVYLTSLARLYGEPGLDTRLEGGDKVIVEEDQRYFIGLGAAGQEQLVYFPKDEISALEALSLLGGISDRRADPRGILILRIYPESATRPGTRGPRERRVVFTIDMTTADGLFSAKRFQVRPGDVVLATESPVTSAETIFGIVGDAFGVARRAGSF